MYLILLSIHINIFVFIYVYVLFSWFVCFSYNNIISIWFCEIWFNVFDYIMCPKIRQMEHSSLPFIQWSFWVFVFPYKFSDYSIQLKKFISILIKGICYSIQIFRLFYPIKKTICVLIKFGLYFYINYEKTDYF